VNVDVLIVGAGPAGAIAALALGKTLRVAVVERIAAVTEMKIGDSLPPVAGKILSTLGLLDDFHSQSHITNLGTRIIWNGSETVVDFMRDPYGTGWHLDRNSFDSMLLSNAIDAGADFLRPAEVLSILKVSNRWEVTLSTGSGQKLIFSRILVDATGRRAFAARRIGAKKKRKRSINPILV
jgi:flavin-dependent dehydrogenase